MERMDNVGVLGTKTLKKFDGERNNLITDMLQGNQIWGLFMNWGIFLQIS